MEGSKTICLFDMDNTLTPPRNPIKQDMIDTLNALQAKGVHIGIVSGSDKVKVVQQCTQPVVEMCNYFFPENGLQAFKDNKEFHIQSLKKKLGDENMNKLINFCLRYMADLDIPVKR